MQRRVTRILEIESVDPERVLAVTFTAHRRAAHLEVDEELMSFEIGKP
jgi:hypothetical protein